MPFKNSLPMRMLALVSILSTVLAFALGPGKAEASGCRTDPILVLTNLGQLQMGANIGTTYSNIQRVVYTVHAPVGTAAPVILYTDNPLGGVERVQYYADRPANSYTIDTIVYTVSGTVSVTTSSLLVNLLGLTLAHSSASGTSGQHLAMSLTRR